MRAEPWLTARPIAHRGLHDLASGVIENSLSAALAAIALEKREVSPVEIRVAVAVTAACSPGGMAPLNAKSARPEASVVTVCMPSKTLPAARSTSPPGSLGVEKYSMRMLSLATLSSVPDRPSCVTVSSTGSAAAPLARLVRAMPPSVLP